jgi:hypothetical protein
MSLMDPNGDPILRFSAFKELARLQEEFKRSKEACPEKISLKKHLIVAIRNFGRLLVDVGYRLERVGCAQTPLKY